VLANGDVEHVSGILGEDTVELLESWRASPAQAIPTRHEQAAGFTAATHGRSTGKAEAAAAIGVPMVIAAVRPGTSGTSSQPRLCRLAACHLVAPDPDLDDVERPDEDSALGPAPSASPTNG